MPKQKLPPGMTDASIRKVIAHYESQTEDEALAEDEAAFADPRYATMQVPVELVPEVRKLIAHQAGGASLSPPRAGRVAEGRKPFGKR